LLFGRSLHTFRKDCIIGRFIWKILSALYELSNNPAPAECGVPPGGRERRRENGRLRQRRVL